jgi:hypothetical protein
MKSLCCCVMECWVLLHLCSKVIWGGNAEIMPNNGPSKSSHIESDEAQEVVLRQVPRGLEGWECDVG